MKSISLNEALTSELVDIKNMATQAVEKTIPKMLYAALRNRDEMFLAIQDDFEFQCLICCLINYASKPSPDSFIDVHHARASLNNPKLIKQITSHLLSTSTHVMKAVGSDLPAKVMMDRTERVLPTIEQPLGLSTDTINTANVINIGSGSSAAGFIPFWTCRFILPCGTDSSLLDMVNDKQGKEGLALFRSTIIEIGGEAAFKSIEDTLCSLPESLMPDDVYGKTVLFPLSDQAIATTDYINISPVPSATMLTLFRDRYFEAAKHYGELSTAQKQASVFPFPRQDHIAIVGSNAQNCGGVVQALGGKATAFRAIIGNMTVEDQLGEQGRLMGRLRSSRPTLVNVSPAAIHFFTAKTPYSVMRKHWNNKLTEVMADVISLLIYVREQGSPVPKEEVRRLNRHEKYFIFRETTGDQEHGLPSVTDINALALQVVRVINARVIDTNHSVGLSDERVEALYLCAFTLLNRES